MTDTGPPYPRGPFAGANGIGLFQIGVSSIGDLPEFDIWQTIISQYANSPRLTSIITSMWAALDPTQIIASFFDNIMNIETAVGYGLDVWGRILGVSRVLAVPAATYLGFEEATPGVQSFNQGPFYSGGTITNNFSLADEPYRALLLAKASFNITDGAAPSINQLLLAVFPDRGNCYIRDNMNMTMDYVFTFPLSPLDIAIIEQSGVFPHTVGVRVNVVQL